MISPIRDTFIVIICASLVCILIVLVTLLAEMKQIQGGVASINESLSQWELIE